MNEAISETQRLDRGAEGGSFNTAAWMWLVRGAAMGALFFAALNAVSFVVRTGGLGSLVGNDQGVAVKETTELGVVNFPLMSAAIGFPFVVWEYGDHSVKPFEMSLNVGIGLLFALVVGAFVFFQRHWLNKLVSEMESQAAEKERVKFQFSIFKIMLATIPFAIVAGIMRTLKPSPEMLSGIYFFGPLVLVLVVMIPRGLSWQNRVAVIVPGTVALVVLAVFIGMKLDLEFDKVLMGVFVCWVPQTVFVALVLTIGLLARFYWISEVKGIYPTGIDWKL